MSGINVAGQCHVVDVGLGEWRKVRIIHEKLLWVGWEERFVGALVSFVVDDTPVLGAAKVQCDIFQALEMEGTWFGREFAEGDDSIADVRTTGDIGVK